VSLRRASLLAACAVVSGTLLAQATGPKALKRQAPVYPPAEEAARHGGAVTLRVNVAPDGSVEKVEVASGTGYAALDQAAVDAVKQWSFAPARDDHGQAVAGSTSFKLTFTPPTPDLDFEITCAELTRQVAELRAAAPHASLTQVPALGALHALAEAADEVLPPEHRGVVSAAMPARLEALVAACARLPDEKVMDVHLRSLDSEGDSRRRTKARK
jgi:periplasmic protein TonB